MTDFLAQISLRQPLVPDRTLEHATELGKRIQTSLTPDTHVDLSKLGADYGLICATRLIRENWSKIEAIYIGCDTVFHIDFNALSAWFRFNSSVLLLQQGILGHLVHVPVYSDLLFIIQQRVIPPNAIGFIPKAQQGIPHACRDFSD